MTDIFICVSSDEERQSIKEIIDRTIFKEDFNMKVTMECDDPYTLLSAVKKRNNPAIYFLNICFNTDINGIKLGAKIREYDDLGVIVFITPHLEMVYLSYLYKVEALDYIIKDDIRNVEKRLKECLERANRKLNRDNSDTKRFKIKQADKIISIPKDEILYFETSEKPHKIVLHKEDGELEFIGKLKDIESSIGDEFFRSYKSYLINLNRIQEVNVKEKTVLMDNGDICLVSKKVINDLIEKI